MPEVVTRVDAGEEEVAAVLAEKLEIHVREL